MIISMSRGPGVVKAATYTAFAPAPRKRGLATAFHIACGRRLSVVKKQPATRASRSIFGYQRVRQKKKKKKKRIAVFSAAS